MPTCFPINKTQFEENVFFDESTESMNDPKRVLIVMDALKEFSMELLEWVLKKFTFDASSRISVLGITPYLNIPLSAKTWSDIWSMDIEVLVSLLEKNEFKNELKYQKVQRLFHLCQKYGVVPEIRTEMGHPLRLLVIEQISTLHATLVVFDRHHDKKHIEYYAKKIPCNMVVVNENGEAHLIKKVKCDIDEDEDDGGTTDHVESSSSLTSTISEKIIKQLNPKSRAKNVKD
ncbi:hypothetical protein C2S52_002980 [Perilla frutescens var. hirtella]|uniref:Uncharacterized protein n=1 Tax=Perilla frutescens var. hirtella TaxID=608512 RepID=A0AAD4JBZ1_PERFH|nr:hypothetical protein C2S52_002980 [Perilla frutescens var. hirtella]KAH6830999.1 hypothetical protein C2S53_006765 [Perilla frutescens var. hirtella]